MARPKPNGSAESTVEEQTSRADEGDFWHWKSFRDSCEQEEHCVPDVCLFVEDDVIIVSFVMRCTGKLNE